MAYPLSNGSVTSLSDILSYTDTVNWIIGATKTGKTTFLSHFIGSLPRGKDIYVLDTSGKYVDNELAQIESVKILLSILSSMRNAWKNCHRTLS